MNLHEECLLKYLSQPENLLNNFQLLALNNQLIEQKIKDRQNYIKDSKINL